MCYRPEHSIHGNIDSVRVHSEAKELHNRMPTWIRKRLKMLKDELLDQLRKTNRSSRRKHNTDHTEQPCNIHMIHNRLTTQRIRNKSDTNAYRDYAKWPDAIVINQNNYASYRRACNEANSCDNKTLLPATPTKAVDNVKQQHKRHTANELVPSRRRNCAERCESESELFVCMWCLALCWESEFP